MNIRGTRSPGPLVVVLSIAALGLAGCGSSDSAGEEDGTAPSSSVPSTPAPSSAAPTSDADPATLEGGCDILLGDEGILDAALAITTSDDPDRERVQNRLLAIVSAENDSLADPAGQLVDYLDDPAEYIEDGEPDVSVTTADADIRETCDVL